VRKIHRNNASSNTCIIRKKSRILERGYAARIYLFVPGVRFEMMDEMEESEELLRERRWA
jgi:hypothetical protein